MVTERSGEVLSSSEALTPRPPLFPRGSSQQRPRRGWLGLSCSRQPCFFSGLHSPGRRPRLACLLEPPLGEEGSREPSKEEAGNSQWPRQVVRKAGSRSLSKLLHLWRAKIHLWKACQAQARTRCKTNTIPGRLAKLRLTLSFVQQTDENA